MARRVRTIGAAIAGCAALLSLLGGCSEDPESPAPPALQVTPDAVVREVLFGNNPPGQYIVVKNAGDGTLTYSASVGGGSTWVRLFGQINGTAPDSFFANISVGGLEAGVYQETIWVASPDAAISPVPVPVLLTLTNTIQPSPGSITFLTVSGDQNPSPQSLVIGGLSSSAFEYTLSEGATWLTISEYAGIAEDTVEVSVDIQTLEPGMYVDSIVIMAPIAEHPVSVVCTLVVASWMQIAEPSSYFLRDLHFFDANNGVAIGLLSNASEVDGFIQRSEDGGASWTPVRLLDEGLGALSFADDLHGWAVGGRGQVVHTVDGGYTWVLDPPIDTLIGLNTVCFVDELHGWAAGALGKLYRTVDGGGQWTLAVTGTTSELKGLHFIDAENGWVVGNLGTILSTSDSGKTWQGTPWPSGDDLWDVVFTNDQTGWIFGEFGQVLHTSNGGQSWAEQQTPTTANLHAAIFSGSGRGWAVGDNGSIIYTADGLAWAVQPSGVSQSLFDVFLLNEDEGWICGDLGTMLHTTGGGL